MARLGVTGLIVSRADEHLNQYIRPDTNPLAWLTGFTGSAGVATVLQDKAAVFSDGRYAIQLPRQVDPALFEARHLLDCPPAKWLRANAPSARVGYDPKLFSENDLQPYVEAGVDLVALDSNPVDTVWTDRPQPPRGRAVPHTLDVAGTASAEKRRMIAAKLAEDGLNAAVICDLASIAWLLNLRGDDVPFTPLVKSFAFVRDDSQVDLFIDAAKLDAAARDWLGNGVRVRPVEELHAALGELAGMRVGVDSAGVSAWFAQQLRARGAAVVPAVNPCLVPKSCKNPTEREGARRCHVRDGLAVAKFLHFLSEAAPAGGVTELSADERLRAFRAEASEYRWESFGAISATGERAAIIHYKPTAESNYPVGGEELYLIDSGGQYIDGTTDVTRTVWTGRDAPPELFREQYTRVLKGLISLDTLKFPAGTVGAHVDAFARRPLWDVGMDFDFAVGHGVGSFLAVHEGPARIARPLLAQPLLAGMVMSNEPGLYFEGSHGIRLENLMLVLDVEPLDARKPFLRFESITLVPFQRSLIQPGLLAAEEIEWIDGYHARVWAMIGPLAPDPVRAWLKAACEPLS